MTHWECTTELRAQRALLVSTSETVPFSSPEGRGSMSRGLREWALDSARSVSECRFFNLEKVTILSIHFLFGKVGIVI